MVWIIKYACNFDWYLWQRKEKKKTPNGNIHFSFWRDPIHYWKDIYVCVVSISVDVFALLSLSRCGDGDRYNFDWRLRQLQPNMFTYFPTLHFIGWYKMFKKSNQTKLNTKGTDVIESQLWTSERRLSTKFWVYAHI